MDCDIPTMTLFKSCSLVAQSCVVSCSKFQNAYAYYIENKGGTRTTCVCDLVQDKIMYLWDVERALKVVKQRKEQLV